MLATITGLTLDSPRVRFNWGFHDAAAGRCAGRSARDVSGHFDRAYATGYLAGQAATCGLGGGASVDHPESSGPAWLACTAPVDDADVRTALDGSVADLEMLSARLELVELIGGPGVVVSASTRSAAQARVNRETHALMRRDRLAPAAAQRAACRATCRLLELATGERW